MQKDSGNENKHGPPCKFCLYLSIPGEIGYKKAREFCLDKSHHNKATGSQGYLRWNEK